MSVSAYQALRSAGVVLQEGRSSRPSELELQAGIYAGEFGVSWKGEDGEAVEVCHLGSWNREPGPDFSAAKVLINGVEHTGDIEVDPDVRDWERHGHSGNRDFGNVVLHLFFRRGGKRFFTRTWDSRCVTQVCLDLPPARVWPVHSQPQETVDHEQACALVEAAAGFRLKRKIEAFERVVQLCGRSEALFQGLAIGLGYKNNKVPFQLVAQRARLSRASDLDGESLLFGLSGFLCAEDFDQGDIEAKDYLGELWRTWWTMRDREARLVLPASFWKFASLRPANHPHRRMGALATIAKSFRPILAAIEARSVKDFSRLLTALEHPYWSTHASVARDALPRPTSLIGRDRASDLAINVLIPSLPYGEAYEQLASLAGPAPNRKILEAASWLGEGEKSRLLRSSLHQQGLLQLHADFFPRSPREVWAGFSSR